MSVTCPWKSLTVVTLALFSEKRMSVAPPEDAGYRCRTSPVAVSGDAAAFEANVPWRVLDPAGGVVATGFATTSEGQVFAPFSFTVELAPGTWTIEISESDVSDGEGGLAMTDTRTVTVP